MFNTGIISGALKHLGVAREGAVSDVGREIAAANERVAAANEKIAATNEQIGALTARLAEMEEKLTAAHSSIEANLDYAVRKDVAIIRWGEFPQYFFKSDWAYTSTKSSPEGAIYCDIPLDQAKQIVADRIAASKTTPLDAKAFIAGFGHMSALGHYNQIHTAILSVLKAEGIDANFIDVGANVGDTALAVADALERLGSSAKVYSFEPGAVFDLARANIYLNRLDHRIIIQHAAVSDRLEYLPMRVLLGHSESGSVAGIEQHYTTIPVAQTHMIKAVRLDGELPLGQPYYLKIDAEGADFAVIRGASGLIDAGNVPVIHLEFMPRYFKDEDAAQLAELTKSFGFYNLRRTDAAGSFDILERIEADAIPAFVDRVDASPHGWTDTILVRSDIAASASFRALENGFKAS